MAYAGKAGDPRSPGGASRQQSRRPLAPALKAPKPVGALSTGVAIGLVVGIGLALLFAPRPGADTRRQLRRGMRRVRRRGGDAWDDLRDELRRARRELKRMRRRARAARAGVEDDASV